MSNDAQGNPIVEGSKYLEAATAKQDDGGKVTLGDGARVALPGDLYPTSALGGGGGGGVTDHGALTGLGDDDHTQYHNDTRGDARYYTKAQVDSSLAGKANSSHTHTLSDITDAGTAAAADTGDFAAASHTHLAAQVTDLGDAATKNVGTTAGTVAAGDHNHSGVYAPVSHTHTLSDVTDAGALAALDTVGTSQIDDDAVTYAKVQNVSATDRILGRSTAGAGVIEEIACTPAGRALLDDANAGAQRTTLGLGSAAVEDASAFAAASHTHTLSQITDAGTAAAADTGDFLAAATDLDDLPNVNTAGKLSGDRLQWDSGSGRWIPYTPPILPAYLQQANNLSDLANAATARTNLGLGTSATQASTAFAAASHTHTVSQITDYKAPGYLIWAEDNTGLATGYQWAFGSNAASSSSKGLVILVASTLKSLGLIASAGAGESGTVEVIKNGTSTGVTITITGAATSATATGLSLSFAAGDILNFETTAVTGTLPGQVTLTAWLELA